MLWEKAKSYALLVEVQTVAATMEISAEIPQNLEINVPYDPALPLLKYTQKPHILPQRYLFIHIHFCPFHNSLEMETTYMSIS